MTCSICIFKQEAKDPNQIGKVINICSRYPPVPYPVPVGGNQMAIMNVRPQVQPQDICGEFNDGTDEDDPDFLDDDTMPPGSVIING